MPRYTHLSAQIPVLGTPLELHWESLQPAAWKLDPGWFRGFRARVQVGLGFRDVSGFLSFRVAGFQDWLQDSSPSGWPQP